MNRENGNSKIKPYRTLHMNICTNYLWPPLHQIAVQRKLRWMFTSMRETSRHLKKSKSSRYFIQTNANSVHQPWIPI